MTAKHLAPRNEVEKGKMDAFDKKFISILGDSIDLPPEARDLKSISEDDYERIGDLRNINI